MGNRCLLSIDDRDDHSAIRLLTMLVGAARPAAGLKLVTVTDLIPMVRRPLIAAASPHRVPVYPYVFIALPRPIPRCPRITMALNRHDFVPCRRWRYFNDDGARKGRSGRNPDGENE